MPGLFTPPFTCNLKKALPFLYYILSPFFITGSFAFSILSGKIMFRDVHYITEDFAVRIQDGFLILRWWRPYIYKEITEGKNSYTYQEANFDLMII